MPLASFIQKNILFYVLIPESRPRICELVDGIEISMPLLQLRFAVFKKSASNSWKNNKLFLWAYHVIGSVYITSSL